jgi:hypothetical protein
MIPGQLSPESPQLGTPNAAKQRAIQTRTGFIACLLLAGIIGDPSKRIQSVTPKQQLETADSKTIPALADRTETPALANRTKTPALAALEAWAKI